MDDIKFKLSVQAQKAIMLALQKGLVEQCDISNILAEFELQNSVDGLIVNNPPVVEVPNVKEEE